MMNVTLSPHELALIQKALHAYVEEPKRMHQMSVFASQVLANGSGVFEAREVQDLLKTKEAIAREQSSKRESDSDALRARLLTAVNAMGQRRAA